MLDSNTTSFLVDEINLEVPLEGAPVTALEQFQSCRSFTDHLCSSLEAEDFVIQSMTDASPVKWHLAHTTWFFETFVLAAFDEGYTLYDERFPYLFNSYYIQAGERFSRPNRGLLSRPTVKEIRAFRSHVSGRVSELLTRLDDLDADVGRELLTTLSLGINHERQHQELILTDIKHLFSLNPLYPSFSDASIPSSSPVKDLVWNPVEEGVYEVGTSTASFHFDNEGPKHRYFIEPFEIASRVVTNGEFSEFVEDGGYRNPLLWLTEGWAAVENGGWTHPLYWSSDSGTWFEFTLNGRREVDPNAPACHLSYFEADAYARWAGFRLPSEFEWETVAQRIKIEGNFSENLIFHPFDNSPNSSDRVQHLFGNVWEWTRSQYSPYPGYDPPAGALGEYNGKFMCNQFVLRGGSCATSVTHIRDTYRNFFAPSTRFQFAGIRLARDV